jgi:hypothetical protein
MPPKKQRCDDKNMKIKPLICAHFADSIESAFISID